MIASLEIEIYEISKPTAIRDLNELEEKGLISKQGDGKNKNYYLCSFTTLLIFF
jgi:Fic family protein